MAIPYVIAWMFMSWNWYDVPNTFVLLIIFLMACTELNKAAKDIDPDSAKKKDSE